MAEGRGSRPSLFALPAHPLRLLSTPLPAASMRPHPRVRLALRCRSTPFRVCGQIGGRGRESNPPVPAKRRQTGFEDLQGHRALAPSISIDIDILMANTAPVKVFLPPARPDKTRGFSLRRSPLLISLFHLFKLNPENSRNRRGGQLFSNPLVLERYLPLPGGSSPFGESLFP